MFYNTVVVALFAEAVEIMDGRALITEPRLLNGAQTVTTFNRFLKANEDNRLLRDRRDALEQLHVLCRIVTAATPSFVRTITINNNRQNPVEPWSLHANDEIQLDIQDKFQRDLGIYYERQVGSFENLSDEDLEKLGITQHKAIELTRLARTLLASDGDIDKLTRFREVFEDERLYDQVFDPSRSRADSRQIVLCYKVQFRLRRLANDIVEKGVNKYAYVQRARNLLWALLCQSILNDPRLEYRAEEFGRGLSLEAQYTDWLSGLATTRCRFLLSELVEDKTYAAKVAEGNFSFMRTKASFKRSMEIAHRKWRWVEKRLNK